MGSDLFLSVYMCRYFIGHLYQIVSIGKIGNIYIYIYIYIYICIIGISHELRVKYGKFTEGKQKNRNYFFCFPEVNFTYFIRHELLHDLNKIPKIKCQKAFIFTGHLA